MENEDVVLPLKTSVEDRYKSDNYEILYSGMSGLVMKASHRLMEIGIKPAQNARVFEVGGGAMPHFYWMNPEKMESYTVSDRMALHGRKMQMLQEKIGPKISLLLHDFESDPSIKSVKGNYTRIIASHVLEHITDPERAIIKWASLLASDGILSIAIPCDPGWAWRCGQIVALKGQRTNLTFREYDLLMSREHVSSAQRILKVIRYYFAAPQIRWFPLAVPVVDFNLVCVINVKASDMRSRAQSPIL